MTGPTPARPNKAGRVVTWVARVLGGLLALVGLVPVVVLFALSTKTGKARISDEAHKAALSAGLDVTFTTDIKYWPLRLRADDVLLNSKDGGAPALQAERVELRPRFFALLAGKVEFDEIAIDAARVRVVLRDKRIVNLGIDLPESKSEPSSEPAELPIRAISLTDSDVDVDLDVPGLKARAGLKSLDADVRLGTGNEAGIYDIAAHAARLSLSRDRVVAGVTKTDDDELCGLDARIRIAPNEILVRRLSLAGGVDEEDGEGSFAGCHLASDDLRSIGAELGHVKITLPQKDGDTPHVSGHVRAALPLGLLRRLDNPPDIAGRVEFDGDVEYDPKAKLPTIKGTVRARELRLAQYSFAKEVETEISIEKDVVRSPEVKIGLAGGHVSVKNLEVKPTVEGIPLAGELHLTGLSFAELMKNLGVSEAPHVGWMLDELSVMSIRGTADPLKIDGELSGRTSNFAVYDVPTTDPRKMRFVGFAEATLGAHLAIRSDEIRFEGLRSHFGKSSIEGGLVKLGFHQDLTVDIPSATIDFEDIGPIAEIPFKGVAKIEAHVRGGFTDPVIKATTSIAGFEFSELPLGDILHADIGYRGTTVTLSGVKARKNKSEYALPSATMEFGGKAAFAMNAQMEANAFNIRDFLGIFKFDTDPRFLEYEGNVDVAATMGVTVGGPTDKCGGGVINVSAKAHLHDLLAIGERFEDGHADLDYIWTDKEAGIEGAELNVRSIALHKSHPKGGSPSGAVLGSMTLARGGKLAGRFAIEDLSVSSLQIAEPWGRNVDGRVLGHVDLSGSIDSYKTDGKVHITPVHVGTETLAASDVQFGITQKPGPAPIGRTRCGGPIRSAFNPATYNPNEDQGEMTFAGTFFGGQLSTEKLTMSRQKDATIRGQLKFNRFQFGPFLNLQALMSDTEPADMGGELTGVLSLDKVIQNHYADSAFRILPETLKVRMGTAQFDLVTGGKQVVFANEKLTLPETSVVLGGALKIPGGISLGGTVSNALHTPVLDMTLKVLPTDLAFLPLAFPRVSRAEGKLVGELKLQGSPTSPDVRGDLALLAGAFTVTGMPSTFGDVNVRLSADGEELRISEARMKTLGGDVRAEGSIPLRGSSMGRAEATVRAKGLRWSPNDGTRVGLDANLNVEANLMDSSRAGLPRLTGEVLVTSAEYTKPFSLEPKLETRHVAESYDPSEDLLTMDITVRTRSPVRIRNNLVTMGLVIGKDGLNIVGTNKRFGARGELDALPGGRARLFSNEFEIRQLAIGFDDVTRFAPTVDALALTEFRRGLSAASGGRQAASWKIELRVFGPLDDLTIEPRSEPALAKEDISLLLTVGVTRAELDANAGAVIAYEAAGAVTGADRAVKQLIPIDEFRVGSWYSPRSGRSEPNLTIGQRLGERITIGGTKGLAGDTLRASAEMRIGGQTSVQLSWDNLATAATGSIGNLGGGFRYRLEVE